MRKDTEKVKVYVFCDSFFTGESCLWESQALSSEEKPASRITYHQWNRIMLWNPLNKLGINNYTSPDGMLPQVPTELVTVACKANSENLWKIMVNERISQRLGLEESERHSYSQEGQEVRFGELQVVSLHLSLREGKKANDSRNHFHT